MFSMISKVCFVALATKMSNTCSKLLELVFRFVSSRQGFRRASMHAQYNSLSLEFSFLGNHPPMKCGNVSCPTVL